MMDTKNLREQFGKTADKKFLCGEIIRAWDEIVDATIAEKVRPVTVDRGVLFVEVPSSAFKDQLKFFAAEIIDALNEKFPQSEISRIRIATPLQISANPPQKKIPPKNSAPSITLDEIILSPEEIAACEGRVKNFSDEKLRRTVLQTLLSQARVQKFRLATGWHKCSTCEVLCPPEEIFCEACRIRVKESMVAELFKIFYDTPQLKTHEARKILLERMPQVRRECSDEAIESARTSLIQRVAGGVLFGDEESADVLKLVALEKRLPPEKLTPAIIRRTLVDLQFNLAESPKVQRYFSKARK